MVCSFFLRSLPGGMDDPTFSKCLLLLPLTLLSHFQGMVGISMGWLDIAVAQERGASNLGRYRTFLKCFAVFAFAITIAFAAMGKSAILSAVCLMMSIMMSVAMKIGGAKLISMLSMGSGDAKSNTVCAGIRKVYRTMITLQPLMLLVVGWYGATYTNIKKTGNRNVWGILFSIMILCYVMVFIGAR
ncbi:hypothetical protein ScalyP_jg4245 [Parmales sp. scaly parma]|nr:hypothetical protein ScalyP_jg4245 [Parmales sp. scaly parma]